MSGHLATRMQPQTCVLLHAAQDSIRDALSAVFPGFFGRRFLHLRLTQTNVGLKSTMVMKS